MNKMILFMRTMKIRDEQLKENQRLEAEYISD